MEKNNLSQIVAKSIFMKYNVFKRRGKHMKRLIKIISIIIILMLTVQYHTVFADVGSFESYDSGSSWGSSSSDWGGSSSWSSSSSGWGSSSSSSSYSSSSSDGDGPIWPIFVIFAFVIIITYIKYSGGANRGPRNQQFHYEHFQQQQPKEVTMNDTFVLRRIKEVDPLFSKEEFLSFAKTSFVKLQEAWTQRDWSTIRTLETNELFEQHQKQLQGYIDRRQINVMERICVKSAYIAQFEQARDKDILTVVLNSKMVDYIIDEDTQKIIKGDKVTDRHSSYKMVFVRKTGIKTQEGTSEIKTTNCPNCGAPTEITSSGKCEYCGSVITTGEHDWALSNLEKIR